MPGGHELEQHTVNPLLFMRGVEFLKNHRRGWDEDFLVKMGEGDGEGEGGVGCRTDGVSIGTALRGVLESVFLCTCNRAIGLIYIKYIPYILYIYI